MSGQHITLNGQIGKGAFAEVFRATDERTQQQVAVKRFKRQSLSAASADTLVTEIALLQRLRHPHIVTLLDHQWDSLYVFLIMEYCVGGDLAGYLKRHPTVLEGPAQECLRQLACGIKFLWEHSLVHRDLKPANILLVHPDSLSYVKIADFGFAQQQTDQSKSLSTRIGTPLYMAPEILTNSHYDAKVDLWSLGIIFYEMLFGTAPFVSRTMDELLLKLTSAEPVQIPANPVVTEDGKTLISLLLTRNPADRLTFEEFFSCSYIDLDNYPMGKDLLVQASKLLQQAVTMDATSAYTEAIKSYREGCRLLLAACKYEMDQAKVKQLQTKCAQYMSRAETLLTMVPASQSASTCPPPPQRSNTSRVKPTMTRKPSSMGTDDELTIATKMIDDAKREEQEGNIAVALQLYRRSAGHFLAAVRSAKEDSARNDLRSLCLTYINHAEKLQRELETGERPPQRPDQNGITYVPPPESDEQPSSCVIQ